MQSAAQTLPVRDLSRLFKALGDETRVRIAALLTHGELCVCHIEKALGLSQPTASRHLGVLRAAGVVDFRRVGTWVHYRLADQLDPSCKKQVQSLVAMYRNDAVLRRDVAKLKQARGPQSCR